ncbi:MAG: DUF3598 family protein [Cyanobacteria bacterium J06621_11]
MPPSSSPPSSRPPLSQWQRLLKNVGTWQGSFTRISPTGELLSDIRTEVELTASEDGKAMHQEVRRYPAEGEPQIQMLDYRSLNRATVFFENGAFSQGSMQWGPFSKFGAELGLISGERRLRLVQTFEKNVLQPITLIREKLKGENLQGIEAAERSPLQLADLIGMWQGEGVTQYADLRPETTSTTQLSVEKMSDTQIRQTISLGPGNLGSSMPPITSVGTLEGSRILFCDGSQPVQVLLLPAGASSTCPTEITPRQPIFLEVGWLIDSVTRQRLIRSFDASGAWVSVTLVTEHKV